MARNGSTTGKSSGNFKLVIDVKPGLKGLQADLGELARSVGDFRDAWPAMAEMLASEVPGLIVGKSWFPLQPSYAIRKAARYGSKATLIATGAMLSDFSNPGNILRRGRSSMSWGTRLPYARAVNFGSTRQRIAARPFAQWSQGMRTKAGAILQASLNRKLAWLESRMAAGKASDLLAGAA